MKEPLKESGRCVVFVTFDSLVALDLVGPLEAFSLARRHPLLIDSDPYRLRVVSEHGRSITTGSGLQIATEAIADLDGDEIDTLIVPGGTGPGEPEAAKGLRAWLARRAPTARRTCSVCTGAFILGAAGLLAGRSATTHWLWLDLLAAEHPSVEVRRGPIFEETGISGLPPALPQGSIWRWR